MSLAEIDFKGGSVAQRLAALYLSTLPKALKSAEKTRKFLDGRTYPVPAEPPSALRRKFEIGESVIAGYRVLTVTPRLRRNERRIIYLHGGAYVNELMAAHWGIIEQLIKVTGAAVTVPLYPLAPEYNHRHAFAFLDAVYQEQLSERPGEQIVFAGDSAGAGLALGFTVALMRQKSPLPSLLILFSPWLDLTLSDPAAALVEPHDVMLGIDGLRACGRLWAGADNPKAPELSPLFADLKGLPPITLFQGTRDLFVVDARAFAQRAGKSDARVSYYEYPGAFHVFMGATFTPEARDVFSKIAADFPQARQ
jgi:epsilon-lactone hydrolase